MISFGTMSPKLIAKIMRAATEASAMVAPMSSHVLCKPWVSCARPLAILNMNTPGIMETTDAKPTAAKGICQRRDTGVRITPTTRHATNAPVAAPAPSMVSTTDDCKALIAGLIIAESTGAAVPWGHSLWQFRAISFPLRASAEMTEEVKRPLPVNVPFGLLVFLLIAIGGTVVASRLVAPKKGVAC